MLAIIGGTGFYALEGLTVQEEKTVETPFGLPSAKIVLAHDGQQTIAFLSRHGQGHAYLPHEINYRANIYALKLLGVKRILSFSAVGSLQQALAPGQFVLSTQYLDLIRGPRVKTFFGEGVVAHVSTAQPVCPQLAATVGEVAASLGMPLHVDKTYACVDGPRLGTQAESRLMADVYGADVVGMTHVPEVFLAREAQMTYCSVGIVTDYDSWQLDPSLHVQATEIFALYQDSLSKAKTLLQAFLQQPLPPQDEAYRQALKLGLLTPLETLSVEKRAMVEVLLA
ncbi:MAG: MTAP family purine nucleoside phosphorylase [Zetaproteobacteria bacterium]|nr:MTAP family purine nucleoside phosphorylase [Zetaproteobacteria bacterium]